MFFAEALLEQASRKNLKLVVVYNTKIKGNDHEEEHSHEEADTLIAHQVLASITNNTWKEICVWSPDTDVLTLLLDVVSRGRLGAQTQLKFLTGKGNKNREIDVVERVNAIGINRCQGLIGLHNFSGSDWGGKFVGLTKKTWVKTYMLLDEEDSVIHCFRELGEKQIPQDLNNGQLPKQVEPLEKFVCSVYSQKGPTTLPSLRWQLFQSKNLEAEMLPPTRASLLPHIARANYTAMRDKTYMVSLPDLPPVEGNGWNIEKGHYVPVKCIDLPAPRGVIELTKCSCKTNCKSRCNCYKNGLPSTPLCKYYANDCPNIKKEEYEDMNDE